MSQRCRKATLSLRVAGLGTYSIKYSNLAGWGKVYDSCTTQVANFHRLISLKFGSSLDHLFLGVERAFFAGHENPVTACFHRQEWLRQFCWWPLCWCWFFVTPIESPGISHKTHVVSYSFCWRKKSYHLGKQLGYGHGVVGPMSFLATLVASPKCWNINISLMFHHLWYTPEMN